eukprot:PhF_6_TR14973/c0_g1_i2/m.23524
MIPYFILLVCCLCFRIDATESPTATTTNITTLTTANYNTAIEENPFWVILFYVPWCPHCKALKPVYEQAAANPYIAQSQTLFASVDCEDQKDLCSTLRIKSFPTIKYVRKGSQPYEFEGSRTYERIVEFAYFLSMADRFV